MHLPRRLSVSPSRHATQHPPSRLVQAARKVHSNARSAVVSPRRDSEPALRRSPTRSNQIMQRCAPDSPERGAGNWRAGRGPGSPGSSVRRPGRARARQARAGAHQADQRIVQVSERLRDVQRERQERLQARPARAPCVQQPAPQRALQGACAGQEASRCSRVWACCSDCRADAPLQAGHAGSCRSMHACVALLCAHLHSPRTQDTLCLQRACVPPASSGAAPQAVGPASAHRPRRAPWR